MEEKKSAVAVMYELYFFTKDWYDKGKDRLTKREREKLIRLLRKLEEI
jgi:hypothetical protein